MKSKIEQGIPIPTNRELSGKWVDLYRAMKPGDSFLVQTGSERDSALNSAKHIGIHVVTRKINGDGFRVWRTE